MRVSTLSPGATGFAILLVLITGILGFYLANAPDETMPRKRIFLEKTWPIDAKKMKAHTRKTPDEIPSYTLILDHLHFLFNMRGEIISEIELDKKLADHCIFDKPDLGETFSCYGKRGEYIALFENYGRTYRKIRSSQYTRIAPDGKSMLLISGDASVVYIRNRAFPAPGPINFGNGYPLTALQWSADGRFAALGFLNGQITMADRNGRLCFRHQYKKSRRKKSHVFFVVKGLVFSEDNSYLLVHYGDQDNDFVQWLRIDSVSCAEQTPWDDVPKGPGVSLQQSYPYAIQMDIISSPALYYAVSADNHVRIYRRPDQPLPVRFNEEQWKQTGMAKYILQRDSAQSILFLKDGSFVVASGVIYESPGKENGKALIVALYHIGPKYAEYAHHVELRYEPYFQLIRLTDSRFILKGKKNIYFFQIRDK